MKSEIDKIDKASAIRRAEDDQRRLEADKKAKELHGQMVAALVTQTGLPVDKARELLQSKGWNFA